MNKCSANILLVVLIPISFARAQDNGRSDQDFYLYSIGNSHTWDFRPSADFLKMAEALQVDIKNGWHINCGQNLQTIWDRPAQTCVEPNGYGTYRDAITIQTFIGGTGAGELYRDAWHLNNVGRYIAGLTVFAQIFRMDPAGIPDFESYHASDEWPSDRVLTSAQKEAIRRIISEVLNF